MIVIERSSFRDESGAISLESRLRGALRFGLRWYGEMEAQQAVTQRLSKALGDEHVLVRNQIVPGTDVTIPLVLLSPQGVRVIFPTPIRGVYRAKLDEWLVFDGSSRRFKRVRPNLQGAALTMANQLLRFLKGQGYPLPEIESVLIFTNPRTHVDTARPSVRIVLADAVDHFADNLQQFPAIMDGEDIGAVLDSLATPKLAEPQDEIEPVAAPERAEAPARALLETPAAAAAGRSKQTGPLTHTLPETELESWAAGAAGAHNIRPGSMRAAAQQGTPRAVGAAASAAGAQQGAPRAGSAAASAAAAQAAQAFVEAPLTAHQEVRPLPKAHRRRAGLTRRQWLILLSIMIIGELIILAGFAYVVIFGVPF